MAGFLDSISKTVKEVGASAMDAAGGSIMRQLEIAKEEIKKVIGLDVTVDTEDIPIDWRDWICKTGVNSICCPETWSFLENSPYNKRKVDLFMEKQINKIMMTVDEEIMNADFEKSQWAVCDVQWSEGSTEIKIIWFPRARKWASDNLWQEGSPRKWWNISDELVFGLQLYQLPGPCFYKSDALDGFEDPDPADPSPMATKKGKRWFQFRHWVIMWFPNPMPGWNYQFTKTAPPTKDGEPFSLDGVISLPSMPDFEFPAISFPSLPDFPDVSAPSMPSAPEMALPTGMPPKEKRPEGMWKCHGIMEVSKDLNVKADGNKIIFSDATVTHIWANEDGPGTHNEKKEHQRFELEASSEEQAESWKLSLLEVGCKEGDTAACCCTIA